MTQSQHDPIQGAYNELYKLHRRGFPESEAKAILSECIATRCEKLEKLLTTTINTYSKTPPVIEKYKEVDRQQRKHIKALEAEVARLKGLEKVTGTTEYFQGGDNT